jgi:hypothetical protein
VLGLWLRIKVGLGLWVEKEMVRDRDSFMG